MAGLSTVINTPILGAIRERKLELGIYAFVIMVCFVDVVTSFQSEYGVGPMTLGQITKPFIFFALFYYTLNMNTYRIEIYAIGLLFAYILGVEIVNGYLHQELSFLTVGISGAFKTTLPFYTYFCLKDLCDKKRINLRIMENTFFVYCGTVTFNVIVPVMLGISFSNYKEGGYSGFYQAGNELNAFLVVSVPMLFYYSLSRRRWWMILLTMTMTFCAILTGSKSTLGSVLLSFAFIPFLLHWSRIITVPLIAIVGGLVATIVWQFLDKIVALFPSGGVYARLVYTLKQNTSILDILLGVRVKLFDYYMDEFFNSSWLNILFGKGYQYAHSFMYPIMGKNKSAEMDIIDFIARYGMIGWTFLALILLWTFVKHLNFKQNYTYSFYFAFFLLSVNAILAGHVLSNSFLVFHIAVLFMINHMLKQSHIKKGTHEG